ncbi:MAG TPA: septal ring lytic transglycosylase RlpA family protein [Longimicrobiales bacterium]|nr:septal ring lytic transglycosylase RlpA family protein [Longimicrobiales bacterium]
MRALGALLLVVSLSGCSIVGYPSGRGDASAAPSIVPASPATGGSVDRSPPIVDVDPDPESVTWRIPPDVRPPDPGHVYEVFGETYTVMRAADGYDQRGEASWYGDEFDGRPTATGETFDMFGLSAAHRTLPLHTFVEVTRLDTGTRVIVRINDRGPFARTDRRIIDLSYGAARQLGMVESGVAPVRVRVVTPPEGR